MNGCGVVNRTYYVMTFKNIRNYSLQQASVCQCLADLSASVTGG